MTDFEKLGQFYLGRVHDLTSDKTAPDQPILYDARDLTTHAVCVGMTGSGKTGLCLALLEEAAIDGIPAICIDPKGDLGNLMLTFPELRSQDFEPWVDSDEATRQGLSSEELAEKTATLWRNGLKQWGQDGDRIRKMRETTDVTIYTPASTAGRQLTVLKSFAAPDEQTEPGSEAFREKILGTVSGLLALMQIDDDPVSSREHILLSTILDHFWRAGTDVDMAMLIRSIQSPPFRKVGFLDVDSFYPSGDRFKLAMSLNNLLASPSFAAWLEGEPLSIPNLLYSPEGKPQIAVISVAHLSDAERMFFVTILLNEVLSWVRSQTGTTSLRAILYMDEVFGYFPPTANPPSKQPMLTLLKQARAFGLGVVLATQNPVDLDYKGLSNCGTWFLGRLQTERDKKRVIEGLEGVAASTGGKFDRGEMEQTLAGLGRRVFLMNNVHEDGPVVFESRWALSFLRGPLSRQQIQTLMESQTGTARSAAVASAGRSMSAKPSDTRGTGAATRSTAASVRSAAASAQAVSAPSDTTDHSQSQHRPVLPPRIVEVFFPASLSAERILYRPAILGQAQVRYVDSSLNIDQWDEVSLLRLAVDEVPDNLWEDADEWDEAEIPELLTEPQADDAIYQELPVRITDPKAYPSWEKSLKAFLTRQQKLVLCECPGLSEASHPGESETDFRIRLRQKAREVRDLEVEKLRSKYATKLSTLEDQIRRAEHKVEREKSQSSEKSLSAAVTIGSSIFGALFGRKLVSSTNISRAGSAIRSATRMAGESAQVRQAEESYAAVIEKRDALNAQFEKDAQEIQSAYDPEQIAIQRVEIPPRKTDLSVTRIVLVWLPYSQTRTGVLERAF